MVSEESPSQPEPGSRSEGLAEAQIAAIEGAFAEHGRLLARLRREVEELREQPEPAEAAHENETSTAERLTAIETRLDQQEQALRHLLQRLIAFFEGDGPGQG